MEQQADKSLNETLFDLALKCGLDVDALLPNLLGNLDALKGLAAAKRGAEPTEWEAHNLDILEAFLASYKPEPG
jgi:hypothetical protein